MHQSQHRVAVLHRADDNPYCKNIIYLVKIFTLLLHFTVYAVKIFWPSFDVILDVQLFYLFSEGLDNLVEKFLSLFSFLGYAFNKLVITFRVNISQAYVFVPLYPEYTETVCKRGINSRDSFAFSSCFSAGM